ncbi:paired amphipathic helix protein Sin3-like 1 [Vicia villosa]|uniref:paired amphipathic helix protein Sin3-like 1 n=1 Tax=Vicia villosa TaxID=3911 RepID=UPI00273B1124|nr:paired amphipathic helix protein Sin3-like 1 [Vicia villosa]
MTKKLCPTCAKKRRVDFEHASKFISKVNVRFRRARHRHVYTKFLETLIMYMDGENTIDGVCKEVYSLFEGHDDLIDGFNDFLP